MKAQIIPFPPERIKRMVEPTWIHGQDPGGTSLAWFLRLSDGAELPTVKNGFDLAAQHDPLLNHYVAIAEARKAKRKRKAKPKVDPSQEPDAT